MVSLPALVILVSTLTTAPPDVRPDAGLPNPAPNANANATVLAHPITIQANRAVVTGKKKQLVWVGNVRAKREDVDLTCDQLTAFYTGSDKNITRLQCDGHVVVVEGDRRGTGDHADFDNVKGILVFTGNPRATQGDNQFEGDKVTFFVGTDLLEVEHAKGYIGSAATQSSSVPRKKGAQKAQKP